MTELLVLADQVAAAVDNLIASRDAGAAKARVATGLVVSERQKNEVALRRVAELEEALRRAQSIPGGHQQARAPLDEAQSPALAAVQQLEARHAAKEAAWQQERGELERRANEADKLRQTLAAAARQALADEARWQDEREEMQATIDDLREALEAQRSASTTPRKTSLAASAVQPIATRARTATEDNERDMQQRISVIEELLKTERDYVDDVHSLEAVVLAPLRAGAVIPAADAAGMIKDIDLLLSCNRRLLLRLQEVTHDGEAVASILSEFIAVALRPYSEYCSGAFQGITKSMLSKGRAAAWAAFRKRVESDPRLKGLPLEACLIKPVQRICRYPLLLNEIKKHTPTASPAYAALQSVIEKFDGAVTTINDIRRESDMMHRAVALGNSGVVGLEGFEFWGLERRLLREEPAAFLAAVSPSKPIKWREALVLMFTDCLVFVRSKKNLALGITSTLGFGGGSSQWHALGACKISGALNCKAVPKDSTQEFDDVLEVRSGPEEPVFWIRFPRAVTLREWKDAIANLVSVETSGVGPRRQRSGKNHAPSPRFGVSPDLRRSAAGSLSPRGMTVASSAASAAHDADSSTQATTSSSPVEALISPPPSPPKARVQIALPLPLRASGGRPATLGAADSPAGSPLPKVRSLSGSLSKFRGSLTKQQNE